MGVKAFPWDGFRIGWFVEVTVKPKDKSKRPGAKAPIVRIRVDMSDSVKLPQTPESIMENADRLRASRETNANLLAKARAERLIQEDLSPYAIEHPSGLRLTHAEVAEGWVIEEVNGAALKSLNNEQLKKFLLDE